MSRRHLVAMTVAWLGVSALLPERGVIWAVAFFVLGGVAVVASELLAGRRGEVGRERSGDGAGTGVEARGDTGKRDTVVRWVLSALASAVVWSGAISAGWIGIDRFVGEKVARHVAFGVFLLSGICAVPYNWLADGVSPWLKIFVCAILVPACYLLVLSLAGQTAAYVGAAAPVFCVLGVFSEMAKKRETTSWR